jgi:ACT domain-containing protein
MNAIISVVGKDQVGILSFVSSKCSIRKANIIEVSQTIVDKYFTMFMVVNIDGLTVDFNDFVDELINEGKKENLNIHVMHEDIFNLMHKI